jgi:outer membrane protein OmpA-like peptidoglycan-associated protein
MDITARKYASLGFVSIALWIATPISVNAQWTVTMRAMQNPLAVGQCTGIEVTIVDQRGFPPVRPDKKQTSGWDFDLEFTAASPDAFAWRDERHRFLCAKAPTAPTAVVVASYPAKHLQPSERVPGLTLQRSIEVAMQGAPAGPMPPMDPSTGSPAGAPGTTAPAGYAAPLTDPSQASGPPGGPAYQTGASPGYPPSPMPQQGPSGYAPASAPQVYPYPVDPATQAGQPGLPPQPDAAQPVAGQPVAAQPVAQPQARNFKQLFQKIGSHARQQARDVAGNTVNYTADAANSVVDNTLTSGSDLIKANVQTTAGGLGGVGQALFSGAKGQGGPGDLAVALATGRVVLRELRFQEHTAVLDPSSGPLLARLAQALLATPGQYLIEAHVDKVEGPPAQALSDQRAVAVKNALISSGVPAMQLVATGYGATRPLTSGNSARIEIARTQ